jgi:hypothetical protein
VARSTYGCGPLEVQLQASGGSLGPRLRDALALYDVVWEGPGRRVHLVAEVAEPKLSPAAGEFLTCARMTVDTTLRGLRATTVSGAWAEGHFDDDGERWFLGAPADLAGTDLGDAEQLLTLVLTTGWRRSGWVPVHSGAVTDGERCALVCASSGGGKSTFTAALVRRGWSTLGDDKLLLRLMGAEPEVAAVLHTFNLDPRTTEWWPELGDLWRLPVYSAWTDKRRVPARAIRADGVAMVATPTDLLLLEPHADVTETRVEPLAREELLSCLLHQTVVPDDRDLARHIVGTVVRVARRLDGWRIRIGRNAYEDPGALAPVEAVLR